MLVMQGEGSSYNRVSCSLPATPNYVDVDDKKKEKKKRKMTRNGKVKVHLACRDYNEEGHGVLITFLVLGRVMFLVYFYSVFNIALQKK